MKIKMCWKKLNYSTRGGIITILIGIFLWIIYFISNGCASGDMCAFGLIVGLFVALFSLIGFWLLGLLIGGILSKKKEITGLGYFFIILGIIIIFSIIYYFISHIT